MKEREISLIDLIVEILLRWRKIAVLMVAGAVLAGAFSYVRSYQAAKKLEAEVQDILDAGADQSQSVNELEEDMTQAQIQHVKDVLAYEAVYQSKLEYQEHAAVMQLDPKQVNQVELTFYISSNKRQLSCDIERVYEDIVQSGELCAYAAKQVGQDPVDLDETISLGRGAGALTEGSNTFKVKLIHSNKNTCQDIAVAVEAFLQKKQQELEKSMGSHRLEMIQQLDSTIADADILERQKSSLNERLSIADAIEQHKAAFTEEESQYYEYFTDNHDSSTGGKDAVVDGNELSAASAENSLSPSVNIRYVIFGMAFAAFIYIFILFIKYVLNERLCATDQLSELYGIPQFGRIPKQDGHKKRFGFVDQWILSLREHNKRRFTKDEALSLSAVAVRMAAVKEGLNDICLIGCGLNKDALDACEAVKGQLGEEGISCEILDHVLYDVEAMRRLEEAKGAVLVECLQSTLYSEICQELELLRRQGIVVLGGIVVE